MIISPTFPKRLRVLFYAVNGVGLGHLTRLLAIAQQLKKVNPDTDLFFITSSDADNLLSKEGIPYVHLPSKTVVSQSGTLTYRKLGRMYAALVNPIFDHFQPHVLVVDTMVTGSFHDLLNVLRFGSCFKLFIHRARKMEAYDQGTVQAQRFYDLVIAPHYQHSEVIPMPVGFEVPLYWSGPLMLLDHTEAPNRAWVRQKLNIGQEDLLAFVSLGGGGDTSNTTTFGILLRSLAQYSNLKILLAEGLLSDGNELDDLLEEIPALRNRIIRTTEYPVARLFKGVDFALAAAGYNTFHELMHFGVPTIFIPKPRGYDDQLARATQAETRGAAFVCEENDDFEIKLPLLIARLLLPSVQADLRTKASQLVPQNHAEATARMIIEQVSQQFAQNEPIEP
ncbi:MAG: glycosyltransferase [Bacteroidota bacterium]